MKNLLRYSRLKEIYTNAGSLLEILALLPVYYLGAERWDMFLITFTVYVVISNVHTRIWYKSMEKMQEE